MADLQDAFFGTIALKNDLISRDELSEALRVQQEEREEEGSDRTLGEICVELLFMTEEEVEQVLWLQQKSEMILEDTLYGRIAVKQGLVSDDQLETALERQRESGYEQRMGEILVELDYLTDEQVAQVLATQERLQQRLEERSREG